MQQRDRELEKSYAYIIFDASHYNIIYTANAIEKFYRQLRKTVKTKGIFVFNNPLMKMPYLTMPLVTVK